MASYTFPNSSASPHLPPGGKRDNFRRVLAVKLLVLPIIAVLRIYALHRGGEQQFDRQLTIKNYPKDWATRKKYSAAYMKAYPRNTLVRIAYASTLVDAGRLAEAEHELWLASIDSAAIGAVLGSSRMIVFTTLAAVQWREDKRGDARMTLSRGCGHALPSGAEISWSNPCGQEEGPKSTR